MMVAPQVHPRRKRDMFTLNLRRNRQKRRLRHVSPVLAHHEHGESRLAGVIEEPGHVS